MLKQVLSQRQGDSDIIREYIENFRKMTDAELSAAAERERKIGIVGVHRQGLYLMALNTVIRERRLQNPLYVEQDCIIGFRDRDEDRKNNTSTS